MKWNAKRKKICEGLTEPVRKQVTRLSILWLGRLAKRDVSK
jgi:hypothetical protein